MTKKIIYLKEGEHHPRATKPSRRRRIGNWPTTNKETLKQANQGNLAKSEAHYRRQNAEHEAWQERVGKDISKASQRILKPELE